MTIRHAAKCTAAVSFEPTLIELWRSVRCANSDVQLAQLLLRHRRRRIDEEILAALRFRESDHVANRLGAAHKRHHAIEPERNPAMGRSAVLKRIQQETELAPLILR